LWQSKNLKTKIRIISHYLKHRDWLQTWPDRRSSKPLKPRVQQIVDVHNIGTWVFLSFSSNVLLDSAISFLCCVMLCHQWNLFLCHWHRRKINFGI
jgi:hypothetical protein